MDILSFSSLLFILLISLWGSLNVKFCFDGNAGTLTFLYLVFCSILYFQLFYSICFFFFFCHTLPQTIFRSRWKHGLNKDVMFLDDQKNIRGQKMAFKNHTLKMIASWKTVTRLLLCWNFKYDSPLAYVIFWVFKPKSLIKCELYPHIFLLLLLISIPSHISWISMRETLGCEYFH